MNLVNFDDVGGTDIAAVGAAASALVVDDLDAAFVFINPLTRSKRDIQITAIFTFGPLIELGGTVQTRWRI